jgi:drug/metabolite transporter (DMT)-like permease
MPISTQLFVLAAMLLILAQLAMSLYHLVRDRGKTKKTVFWLTARILFSVLLFLALCIGAFSGWLRPHTLNFWETADMQMPR